MGKRWSRLSLRWKLPSLIGGLLLLVTAGYSYAAYTGMRDAALAVAAHRLTTVTEQLAGMLRNNTAQLVRTTYAVAASAPVRDFLARPGRGGGRRPRERALAALRPTGTQTAQLAAIRLRGSGGEVLLDVPLQGDGAVGAARDSAVLRLLERADSGVVGPFIALGDSVAYAVAVPVTEGARRLGTLVEWRRLTATPQARDQMNQLLGSKAGLFIGNTAGDVWTDLSLRQPPPPVPLAAAGEPPAGQLSYARPGRGEVLATARPVSGVPWNVLVEFSRAEALAPARLFLRQRELALIAVAVLLVGLIGAWALSRSMTAPLQQVTTAAEAIASDVDTPAVLLRRGDELGRLGDAFNTMAEHVRESRRALEEKVVRRTRELQERNEELEAFAYSISHDLRAPLRAMQGFSRALLEDFGDGLDPKAREYAERVVTGARTLDQLIQDLLAYSRVSRAELRLGPVDLARIVHEARRQLDGELQARGPVARLDVVEPLPAVWGHGPTLVHVLTNLLGNGLKFVPPDRAPVLLVRAESAGGRVRLWVEDNGIGIAPEHHERIFRVFERLHGPDDYPGTGIGLAIVRKGMERMGGRAGVQSQPGVGSRFWIELPSAEEALAHEARYETAG